MAIPNLNDWDDRLDRACRDYLYEPVAYQPAGGGWLTVQARVEYQDATRSFNNSEAIIQAVRVSLLKADVPAKPTKAVRVELGKLDGTYRPVNVSQDEGGTHWEFDVETVSG